MRGQYYNKYRYRPNKKPTYGKDNMHSRALRLLLPIRSWDGSADRTAVMRASARVIRVPAPAPRSIGALGRRARWALAAIAPVTAGARNLLAAGIDVIATLSG